MPYYPPAGVSGAGAAGRVAEWSSSSALQAATLAKSGAGVLTLDAASAYTLTVPATGTPALLAVANTFTDVQTMTGLFVSGSGKRVMGRASDSGSMQVLGGWSENTSANFQVTGNSLSGSSPGPGSAEFQIRQFTGADFNTQQSKFALFSTDGSAYNPRLTVMGATGHVGIGLSGAPSTRLHLNLENATTNAVDTLQTTAHNSSGTPAAGFGVRALTALESSTTADQDAAADDTLWTTATHATRTAERRLSLAKSGTLTEALRIDFGSGAGTTGLLLWDVDNNTLERVTVGAADSGGAGFKLLRIPN